MLFFVKSPLWKKTKTSVQTKPYKRARYKGSFSLQNLPVHLSVIRTEKGWSESMLQPSGSNPIIEVRHSRSSSQTHLKVALLTTISEHQPSKHCPSPFSQSSSTSKSYPSAVIHTYGTFQLLFMLFLLIPPTNLQTIHISRPTWHLPAHGSFTSLRNNYVSNSW